MHCCRELKLQSVPYFSSYCPDSIVKISFMEIWCSGFSQALADADCSLSTSSVSAYWLASLSEGWYYAFALKTSGDWGKSILP